MNISTSRRIGATVAALAAGSVLLSACSEENPVINRSEASATHAGGSASGHGSEHASESATATDTEPEASSSATSGGGATQGIAPGEDAGAARSKDVMFVQMMIPHHQQAVALADLALSGHDASPKVQDLAKRIKTTQAGEIEQMKGMLKSWNSAESTDHSMTMPGLVSEADMKAIAAAKGAAFDKLWLQHMTAHHEGAVTMAQDVIGTTKDPQVTAFAKSIVDAQAKEIAEMKALYGG